MELPQLPVSAHLGQTVVRNKGDSLSFVLEAQERRFELIPYYRVAHERYNLYWRLPT